MNDRQTLGRRGEDLAAEHLARLGWPLLARNWRTRGGELDLVARDGEWLVVVEVRARRGRRFGRPEESVDARKQRRLLQLAARYVHSVGWRGGWRIDVVAIDFPPGSGRVPDSEGKLVPEPDTPESDALQPSLSPLPDPQPDPSRPPREILLPDGTRLRHLRHAVAL
jgi:putative endonuclease